MEEGIIIIVIVLLEGVIGLFRWMFMCLAVSIENVRVGVEWEY